MKEEFNITNITPIKPEMNQGEATKAIKKLLKEEIFTQEKEVLHSDIEAVENKVCGVRHYTLVTLKDGSQWVQGCGDGLARLLGSIYLQKALDHHKIESFLSVETKFLVADEDLPITITINNSLQQNLKNIFTISSTNIISLSRYVGDKKPTFVGCVDVIKKTRFTDLEMYANLRETANNKITIIDTEYGSFSSKGVDEQPSKSREELGGLKYSFKKEEYSQRI